MEPRFQDQVAVITGGARGIGFAVAKRLIAEGGKVAIWDIGGAEDSAKALGTNAIGVAVDIADEASVNAAYATTEAAFGKVDILVTAAGITGPTHPVQ